MIQLPTLYVGVHKKSPEIADLVGDLQKFLLGRGIPIAVDENFGPKTKAVIRSCQKSGGLFVDGVVGPKTWGLFLLEGFRSKDFEEDEGAFVEEAEKHSPNWPPKPAGQRSPNGLILFGEGFTFKPMPLPNMPEYVKADPDWVRDNITSILVPQLMGVRGAPKKGEVLCNRRMVKQLEAFFKCVEVAGLKSRVLSWGGSWVTRYIRGRQDKLSNHTFGTAFDINATWNGFRREPARMGRVGCVRELVPIAYRFKFYWGGWYNDGMHFEAFEEMSDAEVEEAKQGLLLA